MIDDEKVFRGAITLFYKHEQDGNRYLVVENSKTKNVTLVSGAEEEKDQSLEKTAQREITEELGLNVDDYQLVPTEVVHNFVFSSKKSDRAGHKGEYQVFIADVSGVDIFGHTKELKGLAWMTEEEALKALSFPDLKEVFERAVKAIKDTEAN